MKSRLVIVGAGMASAYLLQELARREHGFDITLIGDEAEACYNRVLLSGLLAGDNAEGDLLLAGPEIANRVLTGVRVTGVDPAARQVQCAGSAPVAFDHLVFATGARVARPNLPCGELDGLEVLRTLADARRLRDRAGRGAEALVVGAGLLGLEAAHGLNELGFATTILHRNDWPMNRQLDREGGACLQGQLERRGLRFCCGTTLQAVHSECGTVRGARLADGTELSCDLLLFATGITPNAGLARAAGLAVQRGISVDAHLRTSRPQVYALGECCQIGGHCFGLVAPVREQAAVLAATLLEEPGPGFVVSDWPTQLKISGTAIFSAGKLVEDAEQLVLRDTGAGVYRRLVIRDNRLLGAVLVGDQTGGTWYAELIRSGQDVAQLRSGLMFGRNVAEALQPQAAAA